MWNMPTSNAERSKVICSLFESEVLVWLLLRNWNHPLAEDIEFRNDLLETATEVLNSAATSSKEAIFIEGLPATDMNLIAAIWYAENVSLEDSRTASPEKHKARLDWLESVRRSLPSCFCPQDNLP
jgi:hypothetical protein